MHFLADLSTLASDAGDLFTSESWSKWIRAALWLAIGIPVARITAYFVQRGLRKAGRIEVAQLVSRGVFLTLLAIALLSALGTLGVDLSVLLGAAGIFTVAIGFASQTSASNVISGLFLIGERPFGVGDVIQVGTTLGTVESIDLVSIKLRTFNNLYVRIPNESLFKSEIWTLTHYQIRRYDIFLQISYDADFDYLRSLLFEIADDNTMVLDEPKPIVIIDSFLEGSIKLQYSVWGTQANWFPLRASIQEDLKRRFDREGVSFGLPRSETYFEWKPSKDEGSHHGDVVPGLFPEKPKHRRDTEEAPDATYDKSAESTNMPVYDESNVNEEGKREK